MTVCVLTPRRTIFTLNWRRHKYFIFMISLKPSELQYRTPLHNMTYSSRHSWQSRHSSHSHIVVICICDWKPCLPSQDSTSSRVTTHTTAVIIATQKSSPSNRFCSFWRQIGGGDKQVIIFQVSWKTGRVIGQYNLISRDLVGKIDA